MSTNLLLILTSIRYFHDAELQSHLREFDTAQRLGQNVSRLSIGAHMINVHLAVLNALTNEMKASVDVLTPLVMHWILAELDCRLVVHVQQVISPSWISR